MNWLKKIGFINFLIKTFGPDGIFSSGQEGHAFLIGISETIAFCRPRHKCPEDYVANGSPFHEWHYYCFGRSMGILFWLWCIVPVTIIILKVVI